MEARYVKGEAIYVNAKTKVTVFNATDNSTGEEVIIKEVATPRADIANRFLRESWIQACLSHPNIVQFHGSYYYREPNDSYLCGIIMEKLPCDLWQIVTAKHAHREKLQEKTVWIWLRQLIDALALAQEMGICHRDIKPQNLLVDEARNIIKVGDMGSSRSFDPSESNLTLQGTPGYLSPLLQKHYSVCRSTGHYTKVQHNPYKSDVYSLGITCIAIGLGYLPAEVSQLEGLELTLDRSIRRLDHYSPVLHSFVKLMVGVEEECRPDFLQLRKMFYEDVEPEVGELEHEGCLSCFAKGEKRGKRIALECRPEHYFCGRGCLVEYVTRATRNHEKPLSSVLCRYCRTVISPGLILPHFNGRYPPIASPIARCMRCQQDTHALQIARCEHHFCFACICNLEKEGWNSKLCRVCGVPYDKEQMRKQKAMCSVF